MPSAKSKLSEPHSMELMPFTLVDERTKAAIHRRLKFLLREAKLEPRRFDRGSVMMLRYVSNFCSVGYDGNSRTIRRRMRMSESAYALLDQLDLNSWHRAVQNEHPDPIRAVWRWMGSNEVTDPDQVIARLSKHPMVVVTRVENQALGRCRGTEPNERYAQAGIIILPCPSSGWRKLGGSKPS